MIITMDEKTHTYFVNGEVASISVTELLHKHGLAPNYEGIDNSVLEEARKRGKAIHLDIEAWVRGQEMGFVPETREGLAFAKWAQDKMLEAVPEQAFALDYNGMTVACTVDLRGFFKINGKIYAVIDDHKATSRFYREYVSWQTSIYDYIARSLNGRIVNGEKIKWTGADALICTLFDKDGGLTVKNCDKIPDSEIERLLECELKGEKYTRRELVLPDEMGLELNAAEETLVFYEKAYKAAKERSDKARAALTAEMERQGVFTYESDRLKVSYRAASESVIVDSTRLKREQPQVFAAYSKISKRKATVVIAVKGEEENGGEE